MLLDMKIAARKAEEHKENYEFFSKLTELLESDPEFVDKLVDHIDTLRLKAETMGPLVPEGATTMDLCLAILQKNNRPMGSREIMEEALKHGHLSNVKNPQHAITSALSDEKKKVASRVTMRKRKWSISEWKPPHYVAREIPASGITVQQSKWIRSFT